MTEEVLTSAPFKNADLELQAVADKIYAGQRVSKAEAHVLFKRADFPFIGALANYVREKLHGDKVYFNRNFHIDPTNVCVFSCNFCSYSRLYANREEGWELSMNDMINIVKKYDGQPVTEVHIVGGVHPKMNLYFFADLLKAIKAHRQDLHIKAFTAVELDYMFRKAKLSNEEGVKLLKEAGLD